MYVLRELNRKRLFSDIILDLVNSVQGRERYKVCEKDKTKNYLKQRLKEREKITHKLRKKYRIVKIFYGTTIIITTMCGTVIVGLSSTTLPPLGVTILSIVTLTAALSVKFNLKKQKTDYKTH